MAMLIEVIDENQFTSILSRFSGHCFVLKMILFNVHNCLLVHWFIIVSHQLCLFHCFDKDSSWNIQNVETMFSRILHNETNLMDNLNHLIAKLPAKITALEMGPCKKVSATGNSNDLLNQLNCLSVEFNQFFAKTLKHLKLNLLDHYQLNGSLPLERANQMLTFMMNKLLTKSGTKKTYLKSMWKRFENTKNSAKRRMGKREVNIPWNPLAGR